MLGNSAYTEVGPFVDGETQASTGIGRVGVIDPSTGHALFAMPAGCDEDAGRAVDSARAAFDSGCWCHASASFRRRVLQQLAGLIEREAPTLDALDAEEMGKPISAKYGNAAAAASLMRFNAEAADKVLGDVFVSDPHSFVAQRRIPRGVVAAIVPWNFPIFNAVYKVGPALAAGNCVVLKPSELSSRSAVRLAQLAIDAGLPPGVLNVVPGLGKVVGRALALHREVDMLTFTGSTEVGKSMLVYSGQSNMKYVIAECGGKSPHIVFDDGVDVEAASTWIADLLITNQGQLCSTGSRLLVQRSITRRLLEGIADRTKEIVMGAALDPSTTFGPLASERQCSRVMTYIGEAVRQGARLHIGGKQAKRETGGYFVEPTIFADVMPHLRIAQEEVFGPVLAVTAFDDEAEAIQLANSTRYGLAAYVWTADLARGMRVAKGVKSTVMVNATAPKGDGAGHMGSFEPFGESGIGTEAGMAGIESYLRRQLIWFNHD